MAHEYTSGNAFFESDLSKKNQVEMQRDYAIENASVAFDDIGLVFDLI